jgi:hypothetical protein
MQKAKTNQDHYLVSEHSGVLLKNLSLLDLKLIHVTVLTFITISISSARLYKLLESHLGNRNTKGKKILFL